MNPTSLVSDWSRQGNMNQLWSGVEQAHEGQGRPSGKALSPMRKRVNERSNSPSCFPTLLCEDVAAARP